MNIFLLWSLGINPCSNPYSYLYVKFMEQHFTYVVDGFGDNW